ncbi:F-box/kelch-repeat protein OR23 [Hibiscus syriacus]|uniref:F-box/kelch-repeat protein OR23 n=1 Tax=Hibiscus syriacus TaxID=106335 RepID=A0A6A3A169_HIBSY|nr:F-box/kelch-repeat protein OR23 [Hibiscus syriacus]
MYRVEFDQRVAYRSFEDVNSSIIAADPSSRNRRRPNPDPRPPKRRRFPHPFLPPILPPLPPQGHLQALVHLPLLQDSILPPPSQPQLSPPVYLPGRSPHLFPFPLRPRTPRLVSLAPHALQPSRVRPLQFHFRLSGPPHIYVLGGSLFDTRSFPLDRPSPSSSTFRYNFVTSSWDRLAPMISPRGSFACAAIADTDQIIVAGGGSRHTLFRAAGSRICTVERYDVEKDQWEALDGLPRFRAGCVGFTVSGDGEEREFWVMGGYGDSRTVSGVFPVDEYYKDALVMELKENGGGKWRELGDMWGTGETPRYNMDLNRWQKECVVPRRAACKTSFGFIVLNGELHVLTIVNGIDSTEPRLSRQQKRAGTLFMQIYHPRKKTWRFLVTKLPFRQPLDLSTMVMCPIRL